VIERRGYVYFFYSFIYLFFFAVGLNAYVGLRSLPFRHNM